MVSYGFKEKLHNLNSQLNYRWANRETQRGILLTEALILQQQRQNGRTLLEGGRGGGGKELELSEKE